MAISPEQIEAQTGRRFRLPHTPYILGRSRLARAAQQQADEIAFRERELGQRAREFDLASARAAEQFDRASAQRAEQFDLASARAAEQFDRASAQGAQQFGRRYALDQQMAGEQARQAATAQRLQGVQTGIMGAYVGARLLTPAARAAVVRAGAGAVGAVRAGIGAVAAKALAPAGAKALAPAAPVTASLWAPAAPVKTWLAPAATAKKGLGPTVAGAKAAKAAPAAAKAAAAAKTAALAAGAYVGTKWATERLGVGGKKDREALSRAAAGATIGGKIGGPPGALIGAGIGALTVPLDPAIQAIERKVVRPIARPIQQGAQAIERKVVRPIARPIQQGAQAIERNVFRPAGNFLKRLFCIIVIACTHPDSREVRTYRAYAARYFTPEHIRGYFRLGDMVVPLIERNAKVREFLRRHLIAALIDHAEYRLGMKQTRPRIRSWILASMFSGLCKTLGLVPSHCKRASGEPSLFLRSRFR